MIEYRLVTESPKGKQRAYPKRDEAHALKGLADHFADEKKRVGLGLEPWAGWIETRTVTEWRAAD